MGLRLAGSCYLILLLTASSYAGIDFSMGSRDDPYKGYDLPYFENEQQAIEWANKTPYHWQWERLLGRKSAEYWEQAGKAYEVPYHVNKQYQEYNEEAVKRVKERMILMEAYFSAYKIMLGKADKAQVGSLISISSVPIQRRVK